MLTEQQLLEQLSQHFGFDQFRGNQPAIIQSVLSGSDTFVIMPTGGGKSLCYQLPALVSEGTAIVISPLIALMKNQVDQLRSLQEDENVAHVLNSSLSQKQVKQVKEDIESGKCKIVYIAPETLVKEESIAFFKRCKTSFVAVDEAHCISEWGHDFRPEYRKIKDTVKAINEKAPIIALTATATPKVKEDVLKNLGMTGANVFISSFLRDNLFYEVRGKGKKEHVIKQLVQFIQQRQGQSGVIYALNRKTTEELAELLSANGVNAAAYHAGLESKIRSSVQDGFLMDDIDVICATIAFGMGIDKPDVRFVVHYDIPKSLENYYQETGRAGRDGIDSNCIAFFSHKDINKLEKFLKDKPVAEKEIAGQHITEMAAFAESTSCRRKFLLHYFGETYKVPEEGCGYCDNCANPKEKIDASKDAQLAMQVVQELKENHTIPYLVDFITGKATQQIRLYKHHENALFGKGIEKEKNHWNSVLRTLLVEDILRKDIEKYGLIKLTDQSKAFMKEQPTFEISLFHEFDADANVELAPKTIALDDVLRGQLLKLRKQVAKKHNLPPAVIFLENSINDMATQYPLSNEDLLNIVGVNMGKAKKYGAPFLALIQVYVEENDIDRPTELVIRSTNASSKNKVKIIQQIDQKLSFEEIENNLGLTRQEFLSELETIVGSGTKLNLDYYLDEHVDEDIMEEIEEYFRDAENLYLADALAELEPEGYTTEEIELVRIKFYNEHAN